MSMSDYTHVLLARGLSVRGYADVRWVADLSIMPARCNCSTCH